MKQKSQKQISRKWRKKKHSYDIAVSPSFVLLLVCFMQVTDLQQNIAVQVARAVGTPNSAVLVFVPGMASIMAITDLFEKFTSTGVTYKVR